MTQPEKVTFSLLEAHLWESANILRDPVDAADFKTYIFLLLFFKRISDVYIVIANHPFSLEKCGLEVWEYDPYKRNFVGLPSDKSGDFAWLQHMLASMETHTGRMAVVLPHGVLFRMGTEGAIRQNILEMDLLEAVIGLGPNLFYGTGLAACIIVFRAKKTAGEARQGAHD